MKVYHVVRKELESMKKKPYTFLDGDVYVVETDTTLWIWLGARSYADDKAVGAWSAKQIEAKDRALDIHTIRQAEEPREFKQLLDYEVKYGDTPGFLKHVENIELKDYRLLRIYLDDRGKLQTREVEIDDASFKSDDCFILDAYENLYVWIGKDSQVKEKYEAGKIAREIDVERKRAPIIYTINEGDEPEGFEKLIDDIDWKDKVLAVRTAKVREARKREKERREKKWWQFWK
jgi:hypothetical protein